MKSPELLERFLNHMEFTKGKSINTVNGYRTNLTMFFRYLVNSKYELNHEDIGEVDLSVVDLDFIKQITYDDLEQYMIYLSKVRGNTNNTRARQTAALKSFFNYLELKLKIIKENPTRELDTPKAEKRQPVYLTDDEIERLYETSLQAIDDGKRNAIRDYCILVLFIETGMRRAELASLNISAIKEDVAQTIGKGNKHNTKYFNDRCLKAIAQWLKVRPKEGIRKGDEDALFLSELKCRMDLNSIGNVVSKYVKLSGISEDKHITCHKLRHTFGTQMINKGVDILTIKELLNHSNVATTQIYTHLDEERLRQAVNK